MRRATLMVTTLAMAVPACAPRRLALEPAKSTLGGVFTADQAARGGSVYVGACRECHSNLSHTETFKSRWNGRTLAELMLYMKKRMPGRSPGSLSNEEYTLVLAYMLQMIGMPAGASELSTSEVALKGIRLDTLSVEQGPQ